jgi:hypothetical protein
MPHDYGLQCAKTIAKFQRADWCGTLKKKNDILSAKKYGDIIH